MQMQQRNDDPDTLEGPVPKLGAGLPQLGVRVHHDRPIPGDAVPEERAPWDANSLIPGLNRHLIATVEESELRRPRLVRSRVSL